MIEQSRIKIYDFLYNLFYDKVTKNVYAMTVPQELTPSDREDGFLVLRVGSIDDESEFMGETYGRVRCFVQAFIPPISKGRLDWTKYTTWEKEVLEVINTEIQAPNSEVYRIESDGILSYDSDEIRNDDNRFNLFIKSFIITIDKSENE